MFVRTGFSLLRLQLAVNQNAAKVGEGVRFFTRGLRLLGSDVANGGQLFYRAALGAHYRTGRCLHVRGNSWWPMLSLQENVVLMQNIEYTLTIVTTLPKRLLACNGADGSWLLYRGAHDRPLSSGDHARC